MGARILPKIGGLGGELSYS